jgi:hypothetical protein
MHTALSDMTQEITLDKKLGMATPSAGTKYLHRWLQSGSLRIKLKDGLYVERRGSVKYDSPIGKVYRKH